MLVLEGIVQNLCGLECFEVDWERGILGRSADPGPILQVAPRPQRRRVVSVVKLHKSVVWTLTEVERTYQATGGNSHLLVDVETILLEQR